MNPVTGDTCFILTKRNYMKMVEQLTNSNITNGNREVSCL